METTLGQQQQESSSASCGIASWKPRWLQRFATPLAFLISMCVLSFSDALFYGILGGIATSWETRYGLSATRVGILFTVDTIGAILALFFVSYYGGHPSRHRPRWVGWGLVVNVIGVAMLVLPQFMYGAYSQADSSSPNEEDSKTGHLCFNSIINDTAAGGCSEHDSRTFSGSNQVAYSFLCCGLFLVGVGWAPIRPLALSYIDDNAPKKSGLYIGLYNCLFE